jgi:hypothetical protein
MIKMKRVQGKRFQSLARIVKLAFVSLLKIQKNGLHVCHQGVVFDVREDNASPWLISRWRIGEVDECLFECLSVLNSMASSHLGSHLDPASHCTSCDGNPAVAIRFRYRKVNYIATLSGLTKSANETLVVLSLLGKNYLTQKTALRIFTEGRNALILRFQDEREKKFKK